MRNKKPPFEITSQMIDYVAEISGEFQGLQIIHECRYAGTVWGIGNKANRVCHNSSPVKINEFSLFGYRIYYIGLGNRVI